MEVALTPQGQKNNFSWFWSSQKLKNLIYINIGNDV